MFSSSDAINPNIKTKSQIKTKINWKKTSLWLPFLLLAILMVIVPLIWVFVITLVPTDGYTIKDNWDVESEDDEDYDEEWEDSDDFEDNELSSQGGQ